MEGGRTIKASIVPQCYCTNIYYAVKIRNSGPRSGSLVNTSVISCATELLHRGGFAVYCYSHVIVIHWHFPVNVLFTNVQNVAEYRNVEHTG